MDTRTLKFQPRNGNEGAHHSPEISAESGMGMRFVYRRNDGNFWYVQIKVYVNGKRHYMEGKSFYDRKFGGYQESLRAALAFRDKHALPFFAKVGYDPTLREKRALHAQKMRERPRKFRKRKEAKTGLLANLHYIHLRKGRGSSHYTRCVLEITVNIHNRKYSSTAFSYDFAKYGGKEEAIKAAKNDRNRLAPLVHQKAAELQMDHSKSHEEIRQILKSVRISRTPPKNLVRVDPAKFIKRSRNDDYWIVDIRKELWGKSYNIPNMRFYDSQYGGKHKSKLAARKKAIETDVLVSGIFEKIREAQIRDPQELSSRFEALVSEILSKEDASK